MPPDQLKYQEKFKRSFVMALATMTVLLLVLLLRGCSLS